MRFFKFRSGSPQSASEGRGSQIDSDTSATAWLPWTNSFADRQKGSASGAVIGTAVFKPLCDQVVAEGHGQQNDSGNLGTFAVRPHPRRLADKQHRQSEHDSPVNDATKRCEITLHVDAVRCESDVPQLSRKVPLRSSRLTDRNHQPRAGEQGEDVAELRIISRPFAVHPVEESESQQPAYPK